MTPFVFNSLLEESFFDGICFYSLEQLYNFPDAMNLLKQLSQGELWIGFAAEKIYFRNKINFDNTSQLYLLKSQCEGTREVLGFLWGN
jgi:hypothetical protein